MPETITLEELAWHRKVSQQLGFAQSISQMWLSHLIERYSLNVGPDGRLLDRIREDGTIERNPS